MLRVSLISYIGGSFRQNNLSAETAFLVAGLLELFCFHCKPRMVRSLCSDLANFPTLRFVESIAMKSLFRCLRPLFPMAQMFYSLLLGLVLAAPAFAQANSPWENAVSVLQQAFTSTIARGLSLVAIVVSGLTFAFGEGGSKRVLAGVLFGVGMAIAAVNFLAWLFPG